MGAVRKITIVVDDKLLEDARRASGLGISEVVREGLRAVAASRAGRDLRKLRGTLKLSLNVEALRDDA
jgi:post-segregation antitoxin (ccd killing protein)